MIDYLRRLFSYDDWANREVLKSLAAVRQQPQRSLKLMAHILSAERLWLERLQSQKQTFPVWPELNLAHCQTQADELSRLWREYLDGLSQSDLERTVAYTNSKGEHYSNAIGDILTHVVIHSGYHRGQIAADMRASGLNPAYTDFIHGVRQGKLR